MVYMQNLPISMPIIKAANKSTILALPSAGVSPAVATIVVVLLDAGATVRRAVAVGDAVFAGSDFFGSGLLGFDAAGFMEYSIMMYLFRRSAVELLELLLCFVCFVTSRKGIVFVVPSLLLGSVRRAALARPAPWSAGSRRQA